MKRDFVTDTGEMEGNAFADTFGSTCDQGGFGKMFFVSHDRILSDKA